MSTSVITNRTFTILVIFFTVGTSILISPSILAFEARQDAWLAILLGIGLNLLFILPLIMLGNQYPDQNLAEYCETLLGKWLGKAIAFTFVCFFYLLASLMIGDLGYFLTSQVLHETPMEVLQCMFVFAVGLAVHFGFSAYSRAAEIFFPLLAVLFLLLIVSLLPKYDFAHFLPILEYGIRPILKGAFTFSGLQEFIVLMMIYPLVSKNHKNRGRSFILGLLIGGVILTATTVGSIAVLGNSGSANQLFPAYELAKNINIGNFLERIEGVMIFIWTLSIFIKVTLTFHAALLGLKAIWNLNDSQIKPFIWPLVFGLIIVSLLCYPNTVFVQSFLLSIWTPFTLLFSLLLPLLLLGASWIRKSSGTAK